MHCCEHLEKAKQRAELLSCWEHGPVSESGAVGFWLRQDRPKFETSNESKLLFVREWVPDCELLSAECLVGIGRAKEVIYGRSQDSKWKRETALAKGTEVSQAEEHALLAVRAGPKRGPLLLCPRLPSLSRKPHLCYSWAW